MTQTPDPEIHYAVSHEDFEKAGAATDFIYQVAVDGTAGAIVSGVGYVLGQVVDHVKGGDEPNGKHEAE